MWDKIGPELGGKGRLCSRMDAPSLTSPHILAIPYPLYGHITPLLSLCKILAASAAAASFTFLITQRNQQHLHKIFPPHHPLRHPHGPIRCITLPDGLPPGLRPSSYEFAQQLLRSFENLVAVVQPLAEQLHSNGPPFDCVLSDSHLGWTQDVANKLGVPRLAFFVTVAAECHVYYQSLNLISTGVIPFKAATSGDSPVHFPGLTLARKDFPGFLQIEDSSQIFFRFFIDQTKRLPEASLVLFNSFLELENSVFACMSADFKVAAIGPLFLLEEKMSVPKPQISSHKDECIAWLDTRSPNSVIYVSFGSMAYLSPAKVAALAKGLEASQQAFLWALLPDRETGEAKPLPDGFLDRTRDRGLVFNSWAPQISVLEHSSVGGFLTHCGWNAVMESIVSGVPMLVCPTAGDNILIAKLVLDDWKIGMRLKKEGDTIVDSEAVAKMTRELIEGQEGKELRKRAGDWSAAARSAVETGGSSRKAIEALVHSFVSPGSTSPP